MRSGCDAVTLVLAITAASQNGAAISQSPVNPWLCALAVPAPLLGLCPLRLAVMHWDWVCLDQAWTEATNSE